MWAVHEVLGFSSDRDSCLNTPNRAEATLQSWSSAATSVPQIDSPSNPPREGLTPRCLRAVAFSTKSRLFPPLLPSPFNTSAEAAVAQGLSRTVGIKQAEGAVHEVLVQQPCTCLVEWLRQWSRSVAPWKAPPETAEQSVGPVNDPGTEAKAHSGNRHIPLAHCLCELQWGPEP
jgi:hypothetical protein